MLPAPKPCSPDLINSRVTSYRFQTLNAPINYPKLKNALGISSRSLVHHWSKAGTPGSIPGYFTHIDSVAKASKYINAGVWIGIG